MPQLIHAAFDQLHLTCTSLFDSLEHMLHVGSCHLLPEDG